MLKAFLTFLNEYALPLDQRRTLVAVSGGVDSMVLATLFYQTKLSFAIAHANFNLRGAESDEDEKFVIAWAEAHEIPVHVRNFDTLAIKKDRKVSTQMAARELRYDWFEELRTLHRYDYVATAHHADDAIETLLLNLTRGTGLAGLTGIAPVRDHLIRPLLLTAKADIIAFAQSYDVRFREDSSNPSDDYRRNLLRHEVLPVLQKINPGLESTFRYTAERLRAADRLLHDTLAIWQKKAQRYQGGLSYIAIEAVQNASEPAYHLHHCLDRFGFSYRQTRQVVATLGKTSGRQFFSATHTLVVDRTELIIQPGAKMPDFTPVIVEKDTLGVPLPGRGRLTLHPVSKLPDFVSIPPTTAYFDAQAFAFPLTIRRWQAGDWFCPFGMAGKRKKISDLLIDSKIPLPDKKQTLVLTDATDAILWVMGLRTDHRFRVHDGTREMVRFAFHPSF